MLRKIWPFKKIYALSERVYNLQKQLSEQHSLQEQLSEQVYSLRDELNQLKVFCQNINIVNKEYGELIDKNEGLIKEIQNLIDESHKIYNESEEDKQQDLWFTKYGYDWHISDLQMTCIESEFPGNREQLLALKNTHVGECCFVIGNGPSLRAEDLEELKRRNIFCFASKRINKIFDKTTWRPDIWGASDLDYIKSCQDEISEITGFTKLICAPAFVKEGIRINDAIYYPFIQMERRPPWFNLDIMRGVHFWGTITCKLINFAAYMGFKKIYLLGVDNSYALKKDNTGKIIIDTSQKSYFAEDYMWQNEEANSNVIDTIKALDYVTESYKSLKWHCDQIGVEVVNATRGGALEAYPREDFDEILAQWETTNNEM